MSDIVAVLVIPADKDPGRLLEPGPCDAMPPVVVSGHLCAYEGHRRWQLHSDFAGDGCYMCHYPLRALPLWWNGALCPEGWDRARRALWESNALVHPAHHSLLHSFRPDDGDGLDPARDACEWLAVELVRLGLAVRVVRLTRVDGRLVELEPVGVGT
jgi:hypothetical protein